MGLDADEFQITKLLFPSLRTFLAMNAPVFEQIALIKPLICFIENPDVDFSNWLFALSQS
jgi:hypothetical protein